MSKTIKSAKNEMRTTRIKQDQLYEGYVISELVKGSSPEVIGDQHQKYIESLNGFHAFAFDRVIDSILKDDEETLDKFTTGFKYVSEYIGQRSNWDNNMEDILLGDSPAHIKQHSIDALDRSRTKAHNGVINLFNDLNDYAEENKMPAPYPKSYNRFNKDNPNHRADVADILTRHTTLLERINQVVQEKFDESGKTETLADKYRKMSLGELYKVALDNYNNRQAGKDLTDIAIDGLSP